VIRSSVESRGKGMGVGYMYEMESAGTLVGLCGGDDEGAC
jgi:hypothetical protein